MKVFKTVVDLLLALVLCLMTVAFFLKYIEILDINIACIVVLIWILLTKETRSREI